MPDAFSFFNGLNNAGLYALLYTICDVNDGNIYILCQKWTVISKAGIKQNLFYRVWISTLWCVWSDIRQRMWRHCLLSNMHNVSFDIRICRVQGARKWLVRIGVLGITKPCFLWSWASQYMMGLSSDKYLGKVTKFFEVHFISYWHLQLISYWKLQPSVSEKLKSWFDPSIPDNRIELWLCLYMLSIYHLVDRR